MNVELEREIHGYGWEIYNNLSIEAPNFCDNPSITNLFYEIF